MNRWILRGLTTAGCAAGWWLLTAAPAYADAPATTTAHHAEAGTLIGLRLDLNARPLLRNTADTTHRTRARAISARATGSVGHTMTNKTDRRTTTARTTATVTRNLASARVSAAITGYRTPTTGGVATAHSNPDRRNRPTITDTTRPAATATACLSVLTLDDCGTRGTSTGPAAAIRTAASLDMESLDVCLEAAVLHATTVCAEPATRPSTAGGVVDLCLTAVHLGDTVGCGTASGDQPGADGMEGAEALDPMALEACVVVGVLGDAASCGSGTTTTPGGGTSGGGVAACLAVGPTGCDSPAGTDGIDPRTSTGTGYGTGVSPAGNDDGIDDITQGVQEVFAAYGDALTGEITDLQRTAELPLTGSGLAGVALALIAAGLLLVVGSRRRRTA
ncbi:hypothetical protein AB0368_29945 [Actinoplanes sp. NPDC051475]|uniref:hypothetical protein n=1 Tax=Actinoplanes sp. NPDC051475 TaxID=3157225 RepID=UPI00344F22F9